MIFTLLGLNAPLVAAVSVCHKRQAFRSVGLYEGRPLTVRSVFEPFSMPDRITIFQGPHERMARGPEHLVRLVEDTIWHEVAHYFGMNESQVRAAERERRAKARR